MKQVFAALCVCLLGLPGCDSEPPPPLVTVLATGEDGDAISGFLQDFTADTGVPVSVEWGPSDANADRLISKSGGAVDVLITDNVADIWRAGDRGALRPIQSDAFSSMQDFLKDPDGAWAAISSRLLVVMNRTTARPIVASLDQLGEESLKGQLCLSSLEVSSNRALLAYLIDQRGVKNAERLVRLWVRNLAAPPFASEESLLAALEDGRCSYGIAGSPNDATGSTPFPIDPLSIEISAIGVARHASNPEGAQLLVDWLLRERAPRYGGDRSPLATSIAGWRDEEARLLAERAGYR